MVILEPLHNRALDDNKMMNLQWLLRVSRKMRGTKNKSISANNTLIGDDVL